MKTHTNTFKENIKTLGRELDSKISFEIGGQTIELGGELLNSITPHYEADILKSVMKQLDIDSNIEIPVGTEINYRFGLKVGNSYEYLDFGNYIVYSVEKQEDTRSYKIVAYDKMLYSMKDYEDLGVTYPVTIRNYITALCDKIGLTFANENDTFVNYDKEILNELYLDTEGNSLNYTYRDVLDELAGVTASIICINKDDELEIRYISDGQPSKNILDVNEGFRLGYINSSGTFVDDTKNALFNQNIPVEVGETYCFSLNTNIDNLVISYFGSNNNFISRVKKTNTDRIVNTTPNNVAYVKLAINYNNSSTMTQSIIDNLQVMIEKNNTRTSYAPHIILDTIDEEYLKDINVNFGEKYGPINSVVFSRSEESDNIFLQDEDSIALNGLTEIKIKDNQILNYNNRYDFLEGVYNQLNGFEYYANDFTSTGIAYYDLGDRYNISVDNNTYNCIMLNDELQVTQGLVENIHTDIPEKTETDYKKADKTDRRINQTYLIVNKQEGDITALTSRTDALEDEVGNMYSVEQINELIQNAQTGLTNTFSEAGGNNIFRNTGLWFENSGEDSETNPYEFWNGVVVRTSEDKASNSNAMLLQDTTLSQEQIVPNGTYTVSFKYKVLIPTTVASVEINDVSYSLEADEDTEFIQVIETTSQHIKVEFICETDNGCEVYDMMVNAGAVKLAYSQNQNETTTDTVNISKGITITSSDTDTTFKANADGIRTLDNSGNELAVFTDRGMKTKEMIVENQATICNTLIQDINGQTWFTRL